MTAAAREQAAGLFLAAVHVCEQGLARAPDVIISEVPFSNGNELWDWAMADEELGAIARELQPAIAARVRAILRGMLLRWPHPYWVPRSREGLRPEPRRPRRRYVPNRWSEAHAAQLEAGADHASR